VGIAAAEGIVHSIGDDVVQLGLKRQYRDAEMAIILMLSGFQLLAMDIWTCVPLFSLTDRLNSVEDRL
jgi:hypothetical protein